MSITIRPAEESHIPQILRIEQNTFPQPWTEGGLLSELYSEDAYFPVVLEGDALLGYAIFHRFGDEGELYKIAVDAFARRRGLGAMLMENVVAHAQAHDIASMFLEVRESNMPAIRLYERFGFFSISLRKNYYDKPSENAVVMARSMYGLGSTL